MYLRFLNRSPNFRHQRSLDCSATVNFDILLLKDIKYASAFDTIILNIIIIKRHKYSGVSTYIYNLFV